VFQVQGALDPGFLSYLLLLFPATAIPTFWDNSHSGQTPHRMINTRMIATWTTASTDNLLHTSKTSYQYTIALWHDLWEPLCHGIITQD